MLNKLLKAENDELTLLTDKLTTENALLKKKLSQLQEVKIWAAEMEGAEGKYNAFYMDFENAGKENGKAETLKCTHSYARQNLGLKHDEIAIVHFFERTTLGEMVEDNEHVLVAGLYK